MKTINLKKYYDSLYTQDTYTEVSDEVAEALLFMYREENNRLRRIYYHKAYYSLDQEDGIENSILCGLEKSSEEVVMEQEDERFFLLTLKRLEEAISDLTPIQARRIRARYFLGMKAIELAAAEGVSISVISESTRGAIKKLRRYFDTHGWKLFEG